VLRHLTSVLVAATLATGSVPAQPRVRVEQADVSMYVIGAVARVSARYTFAGNPGAMSFEYLEQPCTIVGPVQLESDGKAVPYTAERTGPWVRLHDTSAVDPGRTSLRYQFRYDVKLAATDVSVPIVVPTSALVGTRRGEPIATIHATLPPSARVIFPRMAFTTFTRSWSARMAALPSAARFAGPGMPNEKCWLEPKNSGGLARIFWALVATLALWVPLYMWWANRQRPAA